MTTEKLYFVGYYNEGYVIADKPSWKTMSGRAELCYDEATDCQIWVDSYDGSYLEEAEDVSFTLLLEHEDELLAIENIDNEHFCQILWVYYLATGRGGSWLMPLSHVMNNYL